MFNKRDNVKVVETFDKKTVFVHVLTYTALLHTVTTLIGLYKKLLQKIIGKFQTDNIESRFGLYRMLSDSNYLVSVVEVLQSEKKIKDKEFVSYIHHPKVLFLSKIFYWTSVNQLNLIVAMIVLRASHITRYQ